MDKGAAKKESKSKKGPHQWTTSFLLEQFSKESDRAAVILTASLLDDSLARLIRMCLVPCPSARDVLFEDTNSPLANFSSKIDVANRLGLISNRLTRDIHIVRKIRNSFAHDIFGCDFENGSVKNRVSELRKSIVFADHGVETGKIIPPKGTREEFLMSVFFILWHLNELIQLRTNIPEASEEPFLYKVSS